MSVRCDNRLVLLAPLLRTRAEFVARIEQESDIIARRKIIAAPEAPGDSRRIRIVAGDREVERRPSARGLDPFGQVP